MKYIEVKSLNENKIISDLKKTGKNDAIRLIECYKELLESSHNIMNEAKLKIKNMACCGNCRNMDIRGDNSDHVCCNTEKSNIKYTDGSVCCNYWQFDERKRSDRW